SITVHLDAQSLSSQLDSMLALYDSSGNLLTAQDSGGSGAAESMTFRTQHSDTYFVAVSGFAGSTGAFRLTIKTEEFGPGAKEQASLAIQQGQSVLILVTGQAGSSGSFGLAYTNLDQFNTPENATLLFPAGAGPSQAAVDDLNGDGKPDLV